MVRLVQPGRIQVTPHPYHTVAELHEALTAVAGLLARPGLHRRVCGACGLVPPHPAASVSPAEYLVLSELTRHERSQQRDVAGGLGIDRAAVCRHLGRLEGRGLVRRVVPPGAGHDPRRRGRFRTPWYEPTPAGHSAVESITTARCAFIAWRLGGWDPCAMEVAVGVLRSLVAALRGGA